MKRMSKTIVGLFFFLLIFVSAMNPLRADIAEKQKSQGAFSDIPLSAYDGDEDEESVVLDEEESEGQKDAGDENPDDNSVDEYNYGDED